MHTILAQDFSLVSSEQRKKCTVLQSRGMQLKDPQFTPLGRAFRQKIVFALFSLQKEPGHRKNSL